MAQHVPLHMEWGYTVSTKQKEKDGFITPEVTTDEEALAARGPPVRGSGGPGGGPEGHAGNCRGDGGPDRWSAGEPPGDGGPSQSSRVGQEGAAVAGCN